MGSDDIRAKQSLRMELACQDRPAGGHMFFPVQAGFRGSKQRHYGWPGNSTYKSESRNKYFLLQSDMFVSICPRPPILN